MYLFSFTEYWLYVKEHLTKHEQDRFFTLKHINTDAGRGRAWLRASLNEHSLERYMHMLLERDELLRYLYFPHFHSQFYLITHFFPHQ